MTRYIFNKAIFISILGHIAVFGLFNFSFGHKIPQLYFANIYSLGSILGKVDLINNKENLNAPKMKKDFVAKFRPKVLVKTNNEYPAITDYYLKPQFNIIPGETKTVSLPVSIPLPVMRRVKEQALMFYPRLPQHFLLFFKDRQIVHIELMYNVVPRNKTNVITLKRKISSGNLEVDLLSMRYIEHYLFIEQSRFMRNKWQTVKIDLSAKND